MNETARSFLKVDALYLAEADRAITFAEIANLPSELREKIMRAKTACQVASRNIGVMLGGEG